VLQLLDELGIGSRRVRFVPVEHHLAHASSAYHLERLRGKTAIVSIDGKGEYATSFFGYGETAGFTRSRSSTIPIRSVVLWRPYRVSRLRVQDGEYKVMGMAPYGDPQKYDLSRLISHDGASFRVNTRLINVIGAGCYRANGKEYSVSPEFVRWLARCETAMTSTSPTSTTPRPPNGCWKTRRWHSSTTTSATSSAKPASSASPAAWRSM
jgi:carbamoyltransferase